MGQQHDQTWVQTETVADLGYTTVASPTPFMAFGYIYVFSGTMDSAGTCMGTPQTTRTSTQSASSASKGYNVYSEAMHWFGMAAEEPIGTVTNSDVQYTYSTCPRLTLALSPRKQASGIAPTKSQNWKIHSSPG